MWHGFCLPQTLKLKWKKKWFQFRLLKKAENSGAFVTVPAMTEVKVEPQQKKIVFGLHDQFLHDNYIKSVIKIIFSFLRAVILLNRKLGPPQNWEFPTKEASPFISHLRPPMELSLKTNVKICYTSFKSIHNLSQSSFCLPYNPTPFPYVLCRGSQTNIWDKQTRFPGHCFSPTARTQNCVDRQTMKSFIPDRNKRWNKNKNKNFTEDTN